MTSAVAQLGYLAVFLGTLLEGETFILLGGFLAHQGHLGLWPVIAVAAMGAFCGDLVYFALGRRYGRAVLVKHQARARFLPWLERLMNRYHTLWIFAVRYLYGVRWLAASLAGSAGVGAMRFSTLSLPACALWALLMGLLGYASGEAFERVLGDIGRYEGYLLLLVLVVGLSYGLILYYQEGRLAGRPPDEPRD
jgi:membrane protein DedA with SNARE-associated domain